MNTILSKAARGGRIGSGLALTVIAIMLAVGGARSAATHGDQPRIAATEAEQLFSDAPDGVDPMVTGPVSASFKARQAEAGCAEAVWPNIPAACYPH
jgi:hypothetical protein